MSRRILRIALPVALTAGAVLGLGAETPSAQQRYQPYRSAAYPRDVVVATSRWGHGTISAPVRPGRHGWQVRLPGGSWIDCARSCSETLRQQTLDFWESNGPQAKDGGPGYFRWNFWF